MYKANPHSPFLQRFISDLPEHLKNEKIKVIAVHDNNLSPIITLQIDNTDYIIIHELKSGISRVLEGEHEIINDNHHADLFKDFIEDVLNKP